MEENNMTTIVLALTELSCGHCIKNVKQTLEKLDGVENAEVTLNFAKVNTSLSPQVLIDAITKAGYGAQVAQPNLVLTLGGLACGHCVKSVENALSAVENLDVFEVDKTEAKIYGTAQAQAVIDAIVAAGYEAVLHTENTANPKSDLPPASQKVINPDPVAVENKEDQVMLLLQGMSCAACVLKVQRALEAVPAVIAAQVNLAESTAIAFGHAEPQALIKAVENAGYGAELLEDEQIRREKQQAQVKKEILQRQWQAVVALLIGFGLMLWGLLGGTMEVNAANQSNWMLVGLITLAVIALTGGHFYQRAVKNLVKKIPSSIAESPFPTTMTVLSIFAAASHVAQKEIPFPYKNFSSLSEFVSLGFPPVAIITALASYIFLKVSITFFSLLKLTDFTGTCLNLTPNFLACL